MLSIFQAQPQSRLVAVKPAAETQNSQRVDMTRDSQPESGITSTLAFVWLVGPQEVSSAPAESPPPMSRREAETIWISSSAMKKPTHMVAKAHIFAVRE